MPKYLIVLFVSMLLACDVLAQEEVPMDITPEEEAVPEEVAAEAVAEEVADADEDEVVEDADLDEQTYEKDDDDFVPTEEIPVNHPTPFPTNI